MSNIDQSKIDRKLRVTLLPNNFIDHSEIVILPHPRNGVESPFAIFQNRLFELFEVDFCSTPSVSNNIDSSKILSSRSFFVGNTVVSNGKLLFASEIHPIIIVLPFLFKRKKEYNSYENYFDQTPFEKISRLVFPFFDNFGQYADYKGQKMWCFDDSIMLSFLKKKFDMVLEFFKIYDDRLQRAHERSFDIFKHYLPSKIVDVFRCFLTESIPEFFPKYIFLNKMVINENKNDKIKKDKKKMPIFSFKKKKIPKFLENNREITSFFKPQKILV